MKFDGYLEEERILYITEWPVQRQMCDIREMFDDNVIIKDVKGIFEFSTKFNVKGDDYIFNAKWNNDDIYSISFDISDSKGINAFKVKKDKRYTGDVIAGVFRSIDRLIKKKDVKGIQFNSSDKDLIQFYDKLSRYIEKRFDFELKERVIIGGIVGWIYKKH